jgi:hypothetical protein
MLPYAYLKFLKMFNLISVGDAILIKILFLMEIRLFKKKHSMHLSFLLKTKFH